MHLTGDMLELSSILKYTLAAIIIFAIIRTRRPKNFPPGPRGLPLVGYAPFVGRNAAETFRQMRSKYGPVMSVQMGVSDWVVLNSYEAIHEAFVKQGVAFAGRGRMLQFMSGGYGLTGSDYGPVWKELRKFANTSLRGFSKTFGSRIVMLIIGAPYLRHLPFFKEAWSTSQKAYAKFLGRICELLNEHKKTYDENDIRDMIDSFIKEAKKRGEGDPAFSDKNLVQYVRELIDAGTGTTRITLCWAFLNLAHNPQYQDKIVAEIEKTLGDEGKPTMKHREEMPFTCAFIQEIQRHRTVVALGVFRKTVEDCSILGYDIPKNTTVVPNIWGVHMDPDIFENPEEFRPERFIGTDGKFIKSNRVIPFSIGLRNCPGEHLARIELFVFLVSTLQKVRVRPNPTHPLPSFHDGVFKILAYEGAPFELDFEERGL